MSTWCQRVTVKIQLAVFLRSRRRASRSERSQQKSAKTKRAVLLRSRVNRCFIAVHNLDLALGILLVAMMTSRYLRLVHAVRDVVSIAGVMLSGYKYKSMHDPESFHTPRFIVIGSVSIPCGMGGVRSACDLPCFRSYLLMDSGDEIMAIPDYQSFFMPLLRYAGDGASHRLGDAYEDLSSEFGLTQEERKELLPSGRQPVVNNRIGWAKTYLVKAGLLESVRRGYFAITDRGKTVLEENPEKLDVKYLCRFSEFVEFQRPSGVAGTASAEEIESTATDNSSSTNPEEALESAYQSLKRALAAELLQTIKTSSPAFFENLVVDLLVRMGYGGSRQEAGSATKLSGDGGIDGIINEDRLGLDSIYIQAKRWDGNPVGRPEIQKFAGALMGQRAKKGVFITTSSFSLHAMDFVKSIDATIVLIDGKRLADLMIEHNVGVTTVAAYDIKRIDSDYFEDR